MTPSEFRTAVLEELSVLAAGETASGDDDTTVSEAYTRLHAELAERDKVWWNVDDNVPDAAADAMIVIQADRLTRKFGVPDSRRLELRADAIRAHKTLAAVGHEGMNTTATRAVYY